MGVNDRRSPAPPWRPRQLGALLLVAALVSACGVEVKSSAGRVTQGPSTDVIGSESESTTTSTPSTTAPPPTDLVIDGDNGAEVNRIAANAIVDLEAWWAKVYPDVYGSPYEKVSGGFFAVDRNSNVGGLPCNPSSIQDVLQNAYYCGRDDAIAWDQEGLMPDLQRTYGDFTVAVVLAHEWGHAIQERTQFQARTVTSELQADCFAGAWARHVTDDADARFDINTQALDQALAGILSLRDAPGSSEEDPMAHGSGFDRVGAFQEGYQQGAHRCSDYVDGDPDPFQFPFNDELDYNAGGDLPLDGPDGNEGINQLAFPSLDAYWADTFPTISNGKAWTPLEEPVPFDPDDPPTCNGTEVTQYRLFLCLPDRYIGYDDSETMPGAYALGDFAVATLYATQYGLAVQDQLGVTPPDQVTATLRGDCFAGAWAAALFPPTPPETYMLTLSPGDLDEGVAVLLSFRTDSDRERQGPGFDRTRAFRTGVLSGPKACLNLEPA